MEKSYQERIAEIRENFWRGQLEIHLGEIDTRYNDASEAEKSEVLSVLERLASGDTSINFKNSTLISKRIFDYAQAREIRKDLGLTQKDLSNKLGIVPNGICLYENGKTRRTNTKNFIKYMDWLESHGYKNPKSQE